MITQEMMKRYRGVCFERGDNYLYIPPHALLRPYIANYTITFPTPETMPEEYTVLPSASATLTLSSGAGKLCGGLRGVNTKSANVGAHANKMEQILLIEFHPGGLYPFIGIDQHELVDSSFIMDELDKSLMRTIEDAFFVHTRVEALVGALDAIFLRRLTDCHTRKAASAAVHHIWERRGSISVRELSNAFFYSEKQLRRTFLQYLGVTPKVFSRIVRVNYALRLMQNHPACLTDVALNAGYFDQPHFIHDFRTICGLTPQAYMRNMSVFYNDEYKI